MINELQPSFGLLKSDSLLLVFAEHLMEYLYVFEIVVHDGVVVFVRQDILDGFVEFAAVEHFVEYHSNCPAMGVTRFRET